MYPISSCKFGIKYEVALQMMHIGYISLTSSAEKHGRTQLTHLGSREFVPGLFLKPLNSGQLVQMVEQL